MSDTPDHSDDRALAGEYVLGLLPEEEHAAFEARLAQEPELRSLTRSWAEDLILMTDTLEPVAPPKHIQSRIEERLFGRPEPTGARNWLRGWMFGGVVAAGLAMFVLLTTDMINRGPQMPFEPELVAEIAAEDRSLVLQAAYDAEDGRLFVQRDAGSAREGRVIELWLIEGGNAPVSLGVLSEDGISVLALSPAQRAALDGAVLAVSDEPLGGSPTGAPTGEVLGAGEITDT